MKQKVIELPGACQDRLISMAEVVNISGLGRSSIYAMIAGGRFPRQVRPGLRSVRWIEREVHDWVDARKQERDAGCN